jgi:hypothetical protein
MTLPEASERITGSVEVVTGRTTFGGVPLDGFNE